MFHWLRNCQFICSGCQINGFGCFATACFVWVSEFVLSGPHRPVLQHGCAGICLLHCALKRVELWGSAYLWCKSICTSDNLLTPVRDTCIEPVWRRHRTDMFPSPQYEQRNLKGKIEGFTLRNKSPRVYGNAQRGKYCKMLQRRNQDQSGLTRFKHIF